MPGLQGENVAALGSPIKKSKLSLKFLQKKETKRALDFSEAQGDELKTAEPEEPEAGWVSVCFIWGHAEFKTLLFFTVLPCLKRCAWLACFWKWCTLQHNQTFSPSSQSLVPLLC